jgi:enoyl-CoA hydratase/carnithine racemase
VGAAEACRKPILAAIHGACIGGGVDLITACDIRYATADARFSVKEIDLAIVADLGTLQRLPRLIGDGLARELAFTGRSFGGEEALAMRLVNRVFADQEALLSAVLEAARVIARKSPATIRGIKQELNYSRDHTVAQGLLHVAKHNASHLFSDDLAEALAATQEGRDPRFSD